MNDQMTSAPGASLLPDGVTLLTGTHLAFMAIFAVLVILGILWGMRLKRRRNAADREIGQDNRDIETTDDAPLARAAVEPTVAPPPAPAAPAPARDEPVAAPSPLADEPIAAAPPEAGAAIEAAAPAAASTPEDGIPVTRLKGLGPKVAARLAELGITDASQLAALSDADAAALDAQLGSFAGRMARDRWIEQARLLTAGDKAGFEAVFGKL